MYSRIKNPHAITFILFLFICSAAVAKSHRGSVRLAHQLAVDEFGAMGYTRILGNLIIQGKVTDLSSLSTLDTIDSKFEIQNCDSLKSLVGLGGITHVGIDMTVTRNNLLTNLSGLNSVSFIGLNLTISNNEKLTSLASLASITSIGGSLRVHYNPVLQSLQGLNNIAKLDAYLEVLENNSLTSLVGLNDYSSIRWVYVKGNAALMSLAGLEKLTSVGESVTLEDNFELTSIASLANLTTVGTHFEISNSRKLTSLIGLEKLRSIGGDLSITFNGALTSVSALNSLISIGSDFYFFGNSSLTSLSGLGNLTSIGRGLFITSSYITSMDGLDKLTSVRGLTITGNNNLRTLSGLDNLLSAGSEVIIKSNEALQDFCALRKLFNEGNFQDRYLAESNLNNPTAEDIRTGKCGSLSVTDNLLSVVSMYPNPTLGSVTIDLGNLNSAEITMRDALGRTLAENINVSTKTHILDLSKEQGLILIEIRSGGVYRLVKVLVL